AAPKLRGAAGGGATEYAWGAGDSDCGTRGGGGSEAWRDDSCGSRASWAAGKSALDGTSKIGFVSMRALASSALSAGMLSTGVGASWIDGIGGRGGSAYSVG